MDKEKQRMLRGQEGVRENGRFMRQKRGAITSKDNLSLMMTPLEIIHPMFPPFDNQPYLKLLGEPFEELR